MYGHLNNSIYALLIDSIVNTYLITHCGLNPSPSSKRLPTASFSSSQVGIVASSYCDYFASTSFPDTLDLGLRITRLGFSSVTYEVGVFKHGEEGVKAVGGFTHVFVDRDGMRPAENGMEEEIRRGLARLNTTPGRTEKSSKL
jgi:acyl-CoA thioester hydrolase